MRGIRRRAFGLFALAAVVVGLAALVQDYVPSGQGGPPLSVHSSQPEGARALYLWMAELGYRPTALEFRPFDVGVETRLLFLLAPGENLSDTDASRVIGWLERGGTLVVAAERQNRLLDRLGIQVVALDARLEQAAPRQPLFSNPPVARVAVSTRAALSPEGPAWVPLLGATEPGGDLVAAVTRRGAGRAFVLAAHRPLGNAGLAQADNWALVLYLLDGVPPGSVVVFDEYHHGLTEHGTLESRLRSEPWGWALFYVGALLFAYLALRGRRFGRAVQASPGGARRSRAEYVATLAALLREGRHVDWVRRQFASQVKREIGSRYRVPPDLAALDFVAGLAVQRPEAAALAEPLGRLEGPAPMSDATLVALMRDVDRVRARLIQ